MNNASTLLPFRKVLSFIFIFSCLLYVLLTSWVNLWIGLHKEEFLKAVRETAGRPFSVETIQFRLPNRLILREVEVESVYIKSVEARFWMALFPRPSLQLRDLLLGSPRFRLKARLNDVVEMGSFLSFPAPSFYHGLMIQAKIFSLRFRRGEILLETDGKEQRLTRVSADILKKDLFRPERFSIQAQLADDPKARFKLTGNVYHRGSSRRKIVFHFNCQKLATAFLKPHLDPKLQLPSDALTASIKIELAEKGFFQSYGRISFQHLLSKEGLGSRLYKLVGPNILYRMKGKVGANTFNLQELSLRSGRMKLHGKGKGVIREGRSSYELSAVSKKMPLRQLQAVVPELALDSGTVWISVTVAGKPEGLSPHLILNVENGSLRYAPLSIHFTKVGGTLRLSQKGLAFGELWAFANHLPIRVGGELLQAGQSDFVFEFSTYPGQLKSLRYRNPLNMTVIWTGSFEKQELLGNLQVERVILRGPTGPQAIQKVVCEGLRTEWRQNLFAARKVTFTQTNFSGVSRHLPLEQVQGSYLLDKNSARLNLLSAELWDGKVLGEMRTHLQGPAHFTSNGKIHLVGMQLPKPFQLIERQDPLTGSLDGEILWQGPRVSGRLIASNGSIGPSEILNQFAGDTGIESLRLIPFKELSLRFARDEEEVRVTQFRLEGEEIKFDGEWKIRGDLIGGRLGARFRQQTVSKSSDLRRLIRFVGGEEWIDFDFQIAGQTAFPRLQWLPGEFKKRVEHKLDASLRSMLEKELEQALLHAAEPAPLVVPE